MIPIKIKPNFHCGVCTLLLILLFSLPVFSQSGTDNRLEKIPVDLETDFALSALPSHLRGDATVYLLDPTKGYYMARKGSNGFICFVSRTEWEWAEFRQDLATPISYDAEGARTIFPVALDVAAMRASGKFTALQIKDSIVSRMRRGVYTAPSRPGVSYMLSPVMRVYPETPDKKEIVTVSMPHYMFYAPYLTNKDIGGFKDPHQGPVVINAGQMILGERNAPHGFMIVAANETERATIMATQKELLQRLVQYKSYFAVDQTNGHH